MIETRALHLFLALAGELHFGRTAEKLGVSQSALSTQLLRIEDRLGTRLFDRGRRSAVALTPAGRTFLEEAKLAMAQLARAERIGRMARRGEAGTARIGFVMSSALNGCLPSALSAVRRALPELQVHVEPMETPEQIEAISDGRLDIGFIRPRNSYPINVEARVIHTEEFLIALSADHPLALRSQLFAAELSGETFIFPQFSASDGLSDAAERLARAGGFEPGSSIRTRDFVSAISLASAGYGVVLAPTAMSAMKIRNVVFRTLVNYNDHIALALAWRVGGNSRLVEAALCTLGTSVGDRARR